MLFPTMKGIGGEIAMDKMTKIVNKQNGNISGKFSILSTGNKQDLIDCTHKLIDLELI